MESSVTLEMAESLRFEEEIQSLIRDGSPPPSGGVSFTALLGLGHSGELLHHPWRLRPPCDYGSADIHLPIGCSPTFPSNTALIERASRFSIFASSDMIKPKCEPAADTESLPIAACHTPPHPEKRKDSSDRSEKKCSSSKKSRKATERIVKTAEQLAGDKEQLPYVHVRARRGQATDNHSLAERARREKINARMKLLQQLVPGCNKISGTALVLDEIINHVQSLQRQVEFLSMRLAGANPLGIDFAGLDTAFFLSDGVGEFNHLMAGEQYGGPAAAAAAADYGTGLLLANETKAEI